ncbi:MAG: AhpC/TSA family protein [Proteobacteria bacterium]|nr:AhpC/TSA family protein [Pseudomonadota bacterium]
MRIKPATKTIQIKLPSIDGSIVDSNSFSGRPYMLSFYRFASCPFCNLRINELVTRYNELDKNFAIIAIFDSTLENLQQHTLKHQSPFPILADEENEFYKKFAIENSFLGVLKGMFFRMPTLFKGLFKGYAPTKIKGSITTMPADFLIDKNGIIQVAYYGSDEGDHLSFDEIKKFSNKIKIDE